MAMLLRETRKHFVCIFLIFRGDIEKAKSNKCEQSCKRRINHNSNLSGHIRSKQHQVCGSRKETEIGIKYSALDFYFSFDVGR